MNKIIHNLNLKAIQQLLIDEQINEMNKYFGLFYLILLKMLQKSIQFYLNINQFISIINYHIFFTMGNINTNEFQNQFTEKEIKKLYARFKQIDSDNSGDLDPHQIFNVPELGQNPLVQRVISIFDLNKDGKISFSEFLTGLASLYGNDDEKKLRFAFKIYDIDEDGYITNGQLFTVLKMMVGNNLTDLQLQQLVDRTILKADLDYDGKISFEEFKYMVKDLDVASKLTLNKI